MDNLINKGKYYLTKEISAAAALCYFGHLVERIEWDKAGKVAYFVIPIEEKTQGILQDFYKGKLAVEPRDFSNRMRELKRMVFDTKNGQ